jgi:2-polyprenyl-3-methyl-5-hydroxy-6-metoxy-1,4-benzoquinol methylase
VAHSIDHEGEVATAAGTDFGEAYFERGPLRHSKQLTQSAYRNLALLWLGRSQPQLLRGHGRSALEIGCGYGYATELFADLGYKTIGTDLSAHAIERARSEVHRDDVSFEVWDATTAWPSSTTFDLIAAFEVVEHLADPRAAIENWYALLNPGGALLFTTPNRFGLASRYWLDPTHLNVLTPQRWKAIVSGAGSWSRVVVRSAQFVPFVWRRDGVMRFISLPVLGANLRVLAVKR